MTDRIGSMYWGVGILSFLIALLATRILLSRFGRFALDEPNPRSLHELPVPRTGGIAVLLGALVALGFGAVAVWLPLVAGLCLAVVSFIDDLRGMPTRARLAAHFVAAVVLAWYVLSPMHWAQLAVIVIALVWITNLYNFMDGSDGLAAGMATIGFGAYAMAAGFAGNNALAALCLALAAASAGFLIHNFHPARIFLGDVGSIPLGFLAGGLGILGWRDDVWSLWFPLLVFGPFIGDATITLLKRLIKGDRVWQAHRDHYYQRMVRMGFGHRATALIGYLAMLVCAGAALYARTEPVPVQAAAFAGASALLAVMALWVDRRWSRLHRSGQAA